MTNFQMEQACKILDAVKDLAETEKAALASYAGVLVNDIDQICEYALENFRFQLWESNQGMDDFEEDESMDHQEKVD